MTFYILLYFQSISQNSITAPLLLTNTINLVQTEDAQFGEASGTNLQRPWYFTNGVRYPKPVRINKKTNRRLAKLLPNEDPRRDRISNQLMFVPHNYEQIRESGKLKTILLYNGLGPWNVKNGTYLVLNQVLDWINYKPLKSLENST